MWYWRMMEKEDGTIVWKTKYYKSRCGPGSLVGIVTELRAGRPGDRILVGGEIFRICPDLPWGPPSLLYNRYRVFPGGKERPGRDADPSTPFYYRGHERVELYLYSPYGLYGLYRDSVPVQGWPLPVPYISQGGKKYSTYNKMKATWIGHILRGKCPLKHVIEGKIEGTRRRGRRRKQLLDGLTETRRCWKLKTEVLDRTVWRSWFGRGCGPFARQTSEWLNITPCRLVNSYQAVESTVLFGRWRKALRSFGTWVVSLTETFVRNYQTKRWLIQQGSKLGLRCS